MSRWSNWILLPAEELFIKQRDEMLRHKLILAPTEPLFCNY